MNSITNVVKVKYGLNDEPEPLFQCPVVVDPKVLQALKGTTKRVETIVSEAACAVELVSRFEAARYVDFAPDWTWRWVNCPLPCGSSWFAAGLVKSHGSTFRTQIGG